jgi:transcriptional regulator with XRE-family HTH domain
MDRSADIVRTARRRARLTQRELAARAGTSQGYVGRIERGRLEPSLAAVDRLVRACGLTMVVALHDVDPHDADLQAGMLRLTPQERVDRNVAAVRLAEALSTAPRRPA